MLESRIPQEKPEPEGYISEVTFEKLQEVFKKLEVELNPKMAKSLERHERIFILFSPTGKIVGISDDKLALNKVAEEHHGSIVTYIGKEFKETYPDLKDKLPIEDIQEVYCVYDAGDTLTSVATNPNAALFELKKLPTLKLGTVH